MKTRWVTLAFTVLLVFAASCGKSKNVDCPNISGTWLSLESGEKIQIVQEGCQTLTSSSIAKNSGDLVPATYRLSGEEINLDGDFGDRARRSGGNLTYTVTTDSKSITIFYKATKGARSNEIRIHFLLQNENELRKETTALGKTIASTFKRVNPDNVPETSSNSSLDEALSAFKKDHEQFDRDMKELGKAQNQTQGPCIQYDSEKTGSKRALVDMQRPASLGSRPTGSVDHPCLKGGKLGDHYIDIYEDAERSKLVFEVFVNSQPDTVIRREVPYNIQYFSVLKESRSITLLHFASREESRANDWDGIKSPNLTPDSQGFAHHTAFLAYRAGGVWERFYLHWTEDGRPKISAGRILDTID